MSQEYNDMQMLHVNSMTINKKSICKRRNNTNPYFYLALMTHSSSTFSSPIFAKVFTGGTITIGAMLVRLVLSEKIINLNSNFFGQVLTMNGYIEHSTQHMIAINKKQQSEKKRKLKKLNQQFYTTLNRKQLSN